MEISKNLLEGLIKKAIKEEKENWPLQEDYKRYDKDGNELDKNGVPIKEAKKIKYKKNDWKKYNKLAKKKDVMIQTAFGDLFKWEDGSNFGVFGSEEDGREIELDHDDIDTITVEGFSSDAQRRAAFASGYKAKGKKKKKKNEGKLTEISNKVIQNLKDTNGKMWDYYYQEKLGFITRP